MVDVTDATFDAEVLASDVPVLVEFTAPWCRPCKAIEPVLVDLGREHGGRLRLARIDIDVNLGVPARFGVLSLPTVIVFLALHGGSGGEAARRGRAPPARPVRRR